MNDKLESLSSAILTLDFAAKGFLFIIIAFCIVVFLIFFLYSYFKNSLLSPSPGKRGRIAALSLGEAFGNSVSNVLILLPILGGILVAAGLALGVSKAVAEVNAFITREKEIKALSIAVNYLNQSDKALDVRVKTITADDITLRLDYRASDPNDSSVPPAAWTREITIAGSEIHFDCVVFNFSYSEVGAGRQRNIAIPYRVFSNKVAAADGIVLFDSEDALPAEDDYGFIPSVYREKAARLLTDAEYARDMGIRSVNGSDVWRSRLRAGERFRITVEQTGGLTLK
jgi:hypothetical protein